MLCRWKKGEHEKVGGEADRRMPVWWRMEDMVNENQ